MNRNCVDKKRLWACIYVDRQTVEGIFKIEEKRLTCLKQMAHLSESGWKGSYQEAVLGDECCR